VLLGAAQQQKYTWHERVAMLTRLPDHLQLSIIALADCAEASNLVCKQLHGLLSSPDAILRLYLGRRSAKAAYKQLKLAGSSSSRQHGRNTDPRCSSKLQLVYSLLLWSRLRSWSRTQDGALRTLQLLCECISRVKLLPELQQQELKTWQQSSSNCSSDAAVAHSVAYGMALLHRLLPYAEHCLLPFCAGGGHVHLVKALLPLSSTAELCQSNILHYARTSAFFAAAAGKVHALKQHMAGINDFFQH
jgi:hypothetical protein